MQIALKLDQTMRAVAMAIGAAIVVSVIAMLVPVGLWETITGSTGISELIPATGAPLGDTARALIAFLFGLLAFAVTVAALLKKRAAAAPAKAAVAKPENVADAEDGPSFFKSMKMRLSDFAASRRGDNVVTELSDLPKLRAGDAHPDAPPRRPISAHTDFAIAAPAAEKPVEVVVAAVEFVEETPVPASDVASMVDRLEAAVALREEQLAKLEAIAKAETTGQQETVIAPEMAEILEPAPRQTILEAVPSDAAKPASADEMDAALRSALETLHRMNARTR